MHRRSSIFLSGVIAIAALLVSFSTAAAAKSKRAKPPKPVPAPNALDGKIFAGAITEYGVNKGREETIEFKDGTFVSAHCKVHKFGEIPYTCTRRADGSLRFTADATLKKSGIVHWDAVVYGNRLDGVMTWGESE